MIEGFPNAKTAFYKAILVFCTANQLFKYEYFICTGCDGHNKLFCTKAITIADNFKKALGDTDKS